MRHSDGVEIQLGRYAVTWEEIAYHLRELLCGFPYFITNSKGDLWEEISLV